MQTCWVPCVLKTAVKLIIIFYIIFYYLMWCPPEWPGHFIYQWCGHAWTRRCCRQCDNLHAAHHMFPSSSASNLQVALQIAHARTYHNTLHRAPNESRFLAGTRRFIHGNTHGFRSPVCRYPEIKKPTGYWCQMWELPHHPCLPHPH